MNGSMSATSNGGSDSSTEHSRTLKLSDSKKAITLLAPSVSECSLWVRRITEARRQFAENEKCRLQRQRSSKYYCARLTCIFRRLVLWSVHDATRIVSVAANFFHYAKSLFGLVSRIRLRRDRSDLSIWFANKWILIRSKSRFRWFHWVRGFRFKDRLTYL